MREFARRGGGGGGGGGCESIPRLKPMIILVVPPFPRKNSLRCPAKWHGVLAQALAADLSQFVRLLCCFLGVPGLEVRFNA